MRILASLSCLVFLLPAANAAEDLTISDIMKEAHKEGMLKRITRGPAAEGDQERLLELYTLLATKSPPQGDKSDWDERTAAMVDAAKAAVAGDTSKLKRAVNCRDCHNYHKP